MSRIRNKHCLLTTGIKVYHHILYPWGQFDSSNLNLQKMIIIKRPPRNNSTAMSEFNTVDQKTIEETVQHLKPSTCCLDTMPSDFLKTTVNSVQIAGMKTGQGWKCWEGCARGNMGSGGGCRTDRHYTAPADIINMHASLSLTLTFTINIWGTMW